MTAATSFGDYLDLLRASAAIAPSCLAGPASSDELARTAAAVGPLPADAVDLWRIHNGTQVGAGALDAVLFHPFTLVGTADAVAGRMDRNDTSSTWSEYFGWSTEFDDLGICVPILESANLSLMLDVSDMSAQLLLFDSYRTERIVTPTGLSIEALFDLMAMLLKGGWLQIRDGRVTLPERWPSPAKPQIDPRLIGIEAWDLAGPTG